MRTKEKFYENLNNKHVSLEKRVERFEFKDVKTLEAMTKAAHKIQDRGIKAVAKTKEAGKQNDIRAGIFEAAAEEVTLWDKKIEKEKQDAQKRLQNLMKEVVKAEQDKAKADELWNKAFDEKTEAINEEAEIDRLAVQIRENMKTQIANFHNAAKSLGVDVSSKIAKYNAAANDATNY